MQVKIRNIKTPNPFIKVVMQFDNVIHADFRNDALMITYEQERKTIVDAVMYETIPEAIIEVRP